MKPTIFKDKIYIGINPDNEKEYLAPPSWDCNWYWGFGYLQNKNIHHHIDCINKDKNLFNAIKEYYTDLQLDNNKLWVFCELMATFYTLKETANLYYRGGSHYTQNPLNHLLQNKTEYDHINNELMPQLFDEVYKLFN